MTATSLLGIEGTETMKEERLTRRTAFMSDEEIERVSAERARRNEGLTVGKIGWQALLREIIVAGFGALGIPKPKSGKG